MTSGTPAKNLGPEPGEATLISVKAAAAEAGPLRRQTPSNDEGDSSDEARDPRAGGSGSTPRRRPTVRCAPACTTGGAYPSQYLFVENWSGTGFLDDIAFNSGTGLWATGDDIVLTLSRTGGLWSLSWNDLTQPSLSG